MATLIIILVAFAITIVIAFVVDGQHSKQDKADGVLATFETPDLLSGSMLRMTATELIEGRDATSVRHPLVGLTARVEDSGTLNRRITATRMVFMGPFALAAKKKQDDREIYLTVEGPNTVIIRTIELKNGNHYATTAREFAMQLNMAAQRAVVQPQSSLMPPPGQLPPQYPTQP